MTKYDREAQSWHRDEWDDHIARQFEETPAIRLFFAICAAAVFLALITYPFIMEWLML